VTPTLAATLDRIEQRITELVQRAPEVDTGIVEDLLQALRAIGSPLALAIARIVELVAEQLVDPGIALPPLAMACATLAGAVRGALGERELEAARYEIDTLQPTPDPPGRVVIPQGPQIPVTALINRARRRRT
jgi:hypothetical protein